MERVSKHNYYLDIAQTVSERSTCLRRRFGAIIVKNDVIISPRTAELHRYRLLLPRKAEDPARGTV